ncbi:GIY-YIG nuclease family protein [Chloroflexota bacterium]
MLDWHLYLVRYHDGSLYTGVTTDVTRRFAEHQENRVQEQSTFGAGGLWCWCSKRN